jgi:hypothetical protein
MIDSVRLENTLLAARGLQFREYLVNLFEPPVRSPKQAPRASQPTSEIWSAVLLKGAGCVPVDNVDELPGVFT